MSSKFDVIRAVAQGPRGGSDKAQAEEIRRRREEFETQEVPRELAQHSEAAKYFQPDEDLVTAVNAAMAVGAPLLLTGEPGTGKTQVAYWIAWYFGIPERLFPLHVKSTTTHRDLIYDFDTVAYFHAAQDPQRKGQDIRKGDFVQEGPLWQALKHPRAIVLIDEIDKAPRDFPNDLLQALDQYSFPVPEKGPGFMVTLRPGAPPPFVVITSNVERRLPEPFLRRCVFHHIDLTPELVRRAVAARVTSFPRLDERAREVAIDRFLELRNPNMRLRKRPATAELLVWLTLLSARDDIDAESLRSTPLGSLPALSALIKDSEDLKVLRKR